MENVPSKPVNFWSEDIRFLSRMAKISSSMLYQAVRGKIILGWVTFPGYVPHQAMVTLPKMM